MNRLWIVLAVMIGLFIVLRLRARRRQQPARRLPPAGPRIQGAQVSAWVHPRMSTACLLDSDLKFGKGFRRKEAPQLPHDAQCGCKVVPFSFTSNEVFNGALRSTDTARTSISGMDPAQAQQLLERLRAVEAQPVPAAVGDYAAAVGVERFAPALHEALHGFLTERHAYLQQHPAHGHPLETGGTSSVAMEPTEPT